METKVYQYTREIPEEVTMSICKFETCQCNVEVFSIPYSYERERIYMVVSVHKKDGKRLIRFGNRQQIQNIVDSYNLDYLGSKKPPINWQ